MPSVSAAAVQPAPKPQARAETSLAPGAWPSILPPNMSLRGGDAGDVRTVLAGGDADVDGGDVLYGSAGRPEDV